MSGGHEFLEYGALAVHARMRGRPEGLLRRYRPALLKIGITTTKTMGEICSVCGKECRGGFEVYERTLRDGTPEIVIDTTPDRNFNVCDACNVVTCFTCS